MNKEELTREIARRLKEIRELYYEEYPDGDFLDLYFRRNVVSFNNAYWEGAEDEGFLIAYNENEEGILINEKYEDKEC